MTKYKAIARIGVNEVKEIGVYSDEDSAALALDKVLTDQTEGMEDEAFNNYAEIFWKDSKVIPIKE